MFLSKTLQPKLTAYPAIGQKKLSGAASRMLTYFMAELALEIYYETGLDLHRQAKVFACHVHVEVDC